MSNPLRHCRTSELVVRLKTSIYSKGGSTPPPVATRLILSNNALDDSSSYGANGLVEGASCQLEWDTGIRVTIQMPKQEPVQVEIWPLEPIDEMKSRVLRQYYDNNESPATWVDPSRFNDHWRAATLPRNMLHKQCTEHCASQTVHRALHLTNSAQSTAPHKQCTEHCASQS